MDIDSRLLALENDMASVKTDLAVILSNYVTHEDLESLKIDLAVILATYATKEDLQKAINTLTWKMYAYGIVLVGAVHVLDRYGY